MVLNCLEEASGFQVKRFIAWGDGGAVYLGMEPDTFNKVVLRVFNEELPKGNAARIERDLGLAIGINHSNVAKTYCCGWMDDQLFMVMEHVDGSLADLIGEGTVLTKRALLYMIQAARGLAAMAEVGLHHGALKPSNFLLTDNEILKVSDLALVHAAPKGCTLPEVGRYLAPEANPDEKADMTKDMYALGAVFYHLLVGKAPNMFKRKRLSTLRKDLPTKFCAKIERLMAQKAEDRFSSYDELLKHLFTLANEYGLEVPPAVIAKPKPIALPEFTTESEQDAEPDSEPEFDDEPEAEEEPLSKPPPPHSPRPDPFNTLGPPIPRAGYKNVEEMETLPGSVLEDATSFLLEHLPSVVATNCVVIAVAYALAFFITPPVVGLLHSLFQHSPIMMLAAPIVVFVVPTFLLVGKMWFCEALTAVMVARRFYNKQGGGEGAVDLCSERMGAIFTGGLAQIVCFWGGACLVGFVFGMMTFFLPLPLKCISFIGLVGFIVYIQTIWSLAVIVAALEDKWAFDALVRSNALVQQKFWPVLGYRIFFAIIGGIGVWGFNVLAGQEISLKTKGFLFLIAMAAQVLTEALAISLFSSGMACAYHHLAARMSVNSRRPMVSSMLW